MHFKKISKLILKVFLYCHSFSYRKASAFAIRYYGFHPKHKFEGFHLFFLANIPQGATVLDVGCGSGELTVDIARKALKVVAYDISRRSIQKAREKNISENIQYFVGDAFKDMPSENFDIAVCSNVLEHLPQAKAFLCKLRTITGKLLIRVPNIESSWINGVKKDLGLEYFLDPQHCKEYTPDTLLQELEAEGWSIESMRVSHELWAVAKKNTAS